ncbi:hypothetical protein D9M71_627270 [compost metagenome]
MQLIAPANQVGQPGNDAGKAWVELYLGIQVVGPFFDELTSQVQITIVKDTFNGGLIRLLCSKAANQRQHFLGGDKVGCSKLPTSAGADFYLAGSAAESGGDFLSRRKNSP